MVLNFNKKNIIKKKHNKWEEKDSLILLMMNESSQKEKLYSGEKEREIAYFHFFCTFKSRIVFEYKQLEKNIIYRYDTVNLKSNITMINK